MFGFFKRKRKHESDRLHDRDQQEAHDEHASDEATNEESVHRHDPQTQQVGDYAPDELEQEAARHALDGELPTGEARTALDEAPAETPRDALAEDVSHPEPALPDDDEAGDSAIEARHEAGEQAGAPSPEEWEKDEILTEAAEEAQAELRRQQDDQAIEAGDTASDQPVDSEPEVGGPAAAQPLADEGVAQTETQAEKKGWFARIRAGLGKTRANLTDGLADLFLGKKQIDDELIEDLETQLLMADVGIDATTAIIDKLSARVSRKELSEPQALYNALQQELVELLEPVTTPLALPPKGEGPFVILMVGVNGVGKTTTIGKLTQRFQAEGRSVMLAAGDTFRAAAVEQLKVWGERNSVPVVAQHTGADSASVIYDALAAAKARKIDVLIADTAGRLHNKSHLMEELKKVRRVMAKLDDAAPHEVMLVLDAGTGQNALAQTTTFNEAIPVTGITLTKLDGTAKGGMIFALAKQMQTPIRFIGVGESLDDLRPFAAKEFVEALFSRDGESAE